MRIDDVDALAAALAAARAGDRACRRAMSAALHVESAGAGPPLVLLHGWAMHSGLWGPAARTLAPRLRVHAVDLPGPWPQRTGRSVHARRAGRRPSRARSTTSGAPLTVVGWSLGGARGAALGTRGARSGSHALVLVATTPRFVAGDDWPHAMARQTLAQFGDELRASYRLTLQRFLSLQTRAAAPTARATLAALRRDLFARGGPPRRPRSPTRSPSCRPPTCAPTCRRSRSRRWSSPASATRSTPAAAGAWLAAALPNARLASIAGAAHVPFLSHPAAFAAALDGFLDAR